MEPNQQNIINQPVSSPSPNKQLNLLSTVIIGVLMLLVGLGGGYLLFANKTETSQTEQIPPTIVRTSPTSVITPTINPTVAWKTYTNSFFQFSLKYPKEWKTLDQKSTNSFNEGAKRNLRDDNISFGLDHGVSLNVRLYENPFVNNISPAVDARTEILQIQGTQAYLYNYFEEGPMPARGYWTDLNIVKGEKVYSMYIVSPENEGSKLELMKQIISTFKFGL